MVLAHCAIGTGHVSRTQFRGYQHVQDKACGFRVERYCCRVHGAGTAAPCSNEKPVLALTQHALPPLLVALVCAHHHVSGFQQLL